MSDDEKVMLICGLVDEGGEVITGTITSSCHKCGVAIYIAPSGQQLIAESADPIVVCNRCGRRAIEEMRIEGEEVKFHVRKESVWELIQHWRRN